MLEPATPLPWQAHSFGTIPGGIQHLVIGANGIVVCRAEDGDTDYIVHAANMFPHLVAALESLLEAGGTLLAHHILAMAKDEVKP